MGILGYVLKGAISSLFEESTVSERSYLHQEKRLEVDREIIFEHEEVIDLFLPNLDSETKKRAIILANETECLKIAIKKLQDASIDMPDSQVHKYFNLLTSFKHLTGKSFTGHMQNAIRGNKVEKSVTIKIYEPNDIIIEENINDISVLDQNMKDTCHEDEKEFNFNISEMKENVKRKLELNSLELQNLNAKNKYIDTILSPYFWKKEREAEIQRAVEKQVAHHKYSNLKHSSLKQYTLVFNILKEDYSYFIKTKEYSNLKEIFNLYYSQKYLDTLYLTESIVGSG